jgi:type IV pilus assembly protein PilX
MRTYTFQRQKQQGVTLVIGLIFLILLTLLGIAATQTNIMQEKMASNLRDRETAFEAAEAALRDAETDLMSGRISGATGFISGCNTSGTYKGQCLPSSTDIPIWLSVDWGDTGTLSPSLSYAIGYGAMTGATVSVGLASVSTIPRYIIEVLPNLRNVELGVDNTERKYQYRITARGYGANPNTVVTLQSLYRLP